MNARRVVTTILKAVPRTAAWSRMEREPYGPYFINRRADIRRVLYCVTPTKGVEDYFRQHKYDLLISHHPFVLDRIPQIVLHTALDCCEGGLNDQWRDALGLHNPQHFDGKLGWYGEIEPISFEALCKKCEAFMERPILGQQFSLLDTIRSVVICSGGGGMVTAEARATGADCYIMGEASYPAEETGIPAIIETGHTNSEWIGARLIERLLRPMGIIVDVAPDSLDQFNKEIYHHFHFDYERCYTLLAEADRGHERADDAKADGKPSAAIGAPD